MQLRDLPHTDLSQPAPALGAPEALFAQMARALARLRATEPCRHDLAWLLAEEDTDG